VHARPDNRVCSPITRQLGPFTMLFFTIYLAGIVIALAVMRDSWPARLGIALVWPLGPLAFVIVISILLVASAILWPVLILSGAALLGVLAWLTL
jgi:hypothetical protein